MTSLAERPDGLRTARGADLGYQLWVSATGQPPRREQVLPIDQAGFDRPPGKPRGGFWTSSARNDPAKLYRATSAWLRWCQAEAFRIGFATTYWLLQPDPAAEVVVIDGYRDLAYLVGQFPLSPGLSYAQEIDYAKLAALGFAGIWLTEDGNHECHFGRVGLDLNSWDVESTLWFGWHFLTVEQVDAVAS